MLFLADRNTKTFVPVTVIGSDAYKAALASFRPPFWDVDRFGTTYDKYVTSVADHHFQASPTTVRTFRTETASYASLVGAVYEIERKLGFQMKDFRERSLLFRFEPLGHLRPEDEAIEPQSLVGVPITLFRRKVGVLLLLSNRLNGFHTQDPIYPLIGDLVAGAVFLLLATGNLKERGLDHLFGDAPLLRDPGDASLLASIGLINRLNHLFEPKGK